MNEFDWDKDKNRILQQTRGISFESIVESIRDGGLFTDMEHPNTKRYTHQRLMVVRVDEYAYVVPYVPNEQGIKFLKTAYPSRAATKAWLNL